MRTHPCVWLGAALAAAQSAAAVPVVASENGAQEVLAAGATSWARDGTLEGVLTRYALESEEDTTRVMTLAQTDGSDLWHLTPTHADIFTPSTSATHARSLGLSVLNATPITFTRPSRNLVTDYDLHHLNSTFHTTYHPLADAETFIHELAGAHPNLAGVKALGHSAEGRELTVVRIANDTLVNMPGRRMLDRFGKPASDVVAEVSEVEVDDTGMTAKPARSSSGSEEKKASLSKKGKKGKKGKKEKKKTKVPKLPKPTSAKPAIVVLGPQHSREWAATSSALYLAHALLAPADETGSLRYLLDDFDFYIIPTPNPDGYVHTWEVDRLWYKNRQQTSPSDKCVGIDMNRNWGHKWAKAERTPFGSQFANLTADAADADAVRPRVPTDPCAPWYPGRRAFEALEANALASFLHALPGAAAFVELRAYGQIVSAPYSYTCRRVTPDAEDQLELALGAARAMGHAYGTTFTTGQLCETLYRAHGNAVDYAYAKVGAKWSYAVHLRDTGTYGFSLPEAWIRPVGEETAAMVEYLAKFVKLHV